MDDNRPPASVQRLPTGTVARVEPGAKWWMYRRPRLSSLGTVRSADVKPHVRGNGAAQPALVAPSTAPDAAPEPGPRTAGLEGVLTHGPSGMVPGVLAVMLLIVVVLYRRSDIAQLPRILIPVVGILATLAIAPRLARKHPDEPWLTRFLVYGVLLKIVASALRYRTLVDSYGNVGDASGYDLFARKLLAFWVAGGNEPMLADRRKTNFVRWFTGVVYWLFGADMIAGFFVFGLLAFVGSYLWYRAAADAVPFVNKRLLCAFLFFAPSLAFWPSSIGKEGLMMLGLGTIALGIGHLMKHRLLRGLVVGAPGGWLLWVVRPHLLALVMCAAAFAYFVARSPKKAGASANASLLRPVGLIVVAFLATFAVNSAAQVLGMKDLSLTSIETELNYTTGQSEQGGSEFETGGNSLSPLRLPEGMATVLLRPFPWEVDSAYQILASLESLAVMLIIVYRFGSVTTSLTRIRAAPFLLYCWTLMILYGATFSSFANFGLLVRQRSLVLPAMFVILSIDPVLAQRRAPDDDPEPAALGHVGS